MKIRFKYIFILLFFHACNTNTMTNNDLYPHYHGNDLGLTYSPEQSIFKVWSPIAETMILRIYENGHDGQAIETVTMTKDQQGLWKSTLKGDYINKYYTFQIQYQGELLLEVPDPYAKATGVNGARAMVVDLKNTNPNGWEQDQHPPLNSFADIIIYELHIRDLSSHPNSGIQHSKKYLGLTETGTTNHQGQKTGIDHIKELGATHVHLLPVFDFMPRSIDETDPDKRFNWGYDPQNYNVPEGSYSTNPYDGNVRIKEFKQMVKTLHDNGLRVIMDVVYNHTGVTEESNFNQLVPKYYYRLNDDSTFSNASACGNETASEKFMMRKLMIESMKYWVEEYHIDGFRVDLMGIHDIATMNTISDELQKIDPTIFIYGEGWTAGDSPLPVEQRSLKAHTSQLNNIAVFNDDIRDGLKGSVFEHQEKGFVNGGHGLEESIKFGVVASTQHAQIDYSAVNYSNAFWSPSPLQTITYVSCHDNHTLFDKLQLTNPKDDEATRLKRHKLAASIVLTSQGIPFLHAGIEMARSKNGVENSFEHPDSINQLDWQRKDTYHDHFHYFKNLIALRKSHPAFKMTTTDMLQQHLHFYENLPKNVVAYQLSNHANNDNWKNIIVIYNANRNETALNLEAGEWNVMWHGDHQNLEKGLEYVNGQTIEVKPISMMILVKD